MTPFLQHWKRLKPTSRWDAQGASSCARTTAQGRRGEGKPQLGRRLWGWGRQPEGSQRQAGATPPVSGRNEHVCERSGQGRAGTRERPAGHVRRAGTIVSTLYPQLSVLTIGQDGLGRAVVTNSPTDLSDCKPAGVVSWSCSTVTAGRPGSSRQSLITSDRPHLGKKLGRNS